MIAELVQWDHTVFRHINHDWANAAFDAFFPAITDLHRNPIFLACMVPLLALWVWKQRGLAVKWILLLALSIGLADAASYRVIKAQAQRARPAEAGLEVDLRTNKHSGTSFPSNHAANIFAGATVLTFAFPGWWPVLFYAIAASVGYSRIYVGVHFPLDVIAGALLGICIAITVVSVTRRFVRMW
ncbi:MAG TPA: phosphatase PAP2 family protein [Bdellovibrionales bacterium]|nr:phosphatase PAP2 family protein [Bdellovibrionales bacterium]